MTSVEKMMTIRMIMMKVSQMIQNSTKGVRSSAKVGQGITKAASYRNLAVCFHLLPRRFQS